MAGTFGSGIKSVQRGIVTMDTDPDTVTITAVVLAKSDLSISQSPSGNDTTSVRAVLTNTTTITLESIVGTAVNLVAWQVVEYY